MMQNKFIADRFSSFSSGLALDTEALSRYDDVIDLSIGETDFITDSRIMDAAFSDARRGYTHYGNPQGDPELIDAVCKVYKEDFDIEISKGNVFVTASSCMGMGLAMMAVLNPGDEVLVFAPFFSPYRQQIELAHGVCIEVPTFEAEGYAITEERLRAAITPRTKAMILNNPCNPTGAVYGMEQLELIASIAEEYDLLVVADEIYTRYVFSGAFTPICSLPGMECRTLTLNSFSKNFMMTGWRIGYIVTTPRLVQVLMHINNSLVYTAPSISQRAALKALSLREDITEKYISQYRQRLYYAAERANALPYMSAVQSGGTFYLFPNIRSTGLSSVEFCKKLLNEAHILATPGSMFGAAGEGHIRIVCATPIATLKAAFDRMEHLKF